VVQQGIAILAWPRLLFWTLFKNLYYYLLQLVVPHNQYLSTLPRDTLKMSLIALPLRSVFHVLCNVPAPSAFSADKSSAALPQAAPHNPCPVFPIGTSKGCHNVSYIMCSLC
jgi:hypothetical protein